MKPLRTIIAAALFLSASSLSAAFAQDTPPDEAPAQEGNAQINQQIDLYATATLGWTVEQRCKYLGDELDSQFAANYKVIDTFMQQLLVDDAWSDMKAGVIGVANDDVSFQCGAEMIDYTAETFRLTRDLANNIRELNALSKK